MRSGLNYSEKEDNLTRSKSAGCRSDFSKQLSPDLISGSVGTR